MDCRACSQSAVRSPWSSYITTLLYRVRGPQSFVRELYFILTALFTLQSISKNTIATEMTKLLGIYIYIYVYRIERGKCSANLKPTGIVLKWRKYGTQTLARYQEDKVSHFWSIHALYFRLKNTFVNYHTNPYNLRHCVTLIVT